MRSIFLSIGFLIFGVAQIFAQNGQKTSEFTEYGDKIGVGICILDGFGVPVRYYFSPKAVVEGGLYMGGIFEQVPNSDDVELHNGLQFGGGLSFFGDRFEKSKRKKTKIRANGVALRASYLTGDYAAFRPSISWAQETFRAGRTGRSFIFELGIEGIVADFPYETDPGVGIHLRCHWNFFL